MHKYKYVQLIREKKNFSSPPTNQYTRIRTSCRGLRRVQLFYNQPEPKQLDNKQLLCARQGGQRPGDRLLSYIQFNVIKLNFKIHRMPNSEMNFISGSILDTRTLRGTPHQRVYGEWTHGIVTCSVSKRSKQHVHSQGIYRVPTSSRCFFPRLREKCANRTEI